MSASRHHAQARRVVTLLSGEMVAIMETEETVLRAGDTLIQRGTKHTWSNRSGAPAVLQSLMYAAK